MLARALARSRLEPVREPFVQLGADRLRDRPVGGITDQLVANRNASS